MKRRASLAALFLVLLTFFLNYGELREWIFYSVQAAKVWSAHGYRGNGRHADACRELVERLVPDGTEVYYCSDSHDGGLQPAERSIHIALSWAASPRPVRFGEGGGGAGAIVVSRFRRVEFPGFRRVAENDCAALWLKEGVLPKNEDFLPAVSPVREAAGVAVVGLLVFAFGRFAVRGGSAVGGAWPCAAVVLLVAGGLALAHTFVAPTGLGVWGGKAKLLYLCGGLPGGFFVDPARATLQPAYPPGLALLTLLAYAVSGGCGEWLVQLVVVFAASALCALLCSRTGSWPALLWILAALLTPLSLRVSSLYYAEPFVALLVLAGWMRIREGRGVLSGWALVGAAGLFKGEGVVLCLACWAALRLTDGRRAAHPRGLLAALALPCAWQVGVRLAGGTLYDFAAPWQPDFARLWTAAGFALRAAFLRPWDYIFAWPLAALLLAAAPFRRRFAADRADCRGLRAAALAALAASAAFVFVFSLSRATDFGWHLSTALPRLLWVPSLLLLAEIVAFSSRAEPQSPQRVRVGGSVAIRQVEKTP